LTGGSASWPNAPLHAACWPIHRRGLGAPGPSSRPCAAPAQQPNPGGLAGARPPVGSVDPREPHRRSGSLGRTGPPDSILGNPVCAGGQGGEDDLDRRLQSAGSPDCRHVLSLAWDLKSVGLRQSGSPKRLAERGQSPLLNLSVSPSACGRVSMNGRLVARSRRRHSLQDPPPVRIWIRSLPAPLRALLRTPRDQAASCAGPLPRRFSSHPCRHAGKRASFLHQVRADGMQARRGHVTLDAHVAAPGPK